MTVHDAGAGPTVTAVPCGASPGVHPPRLLLIPEQGHVSKAGHQGGGHLGRWTDQRRGHLGREASNEVTDFATSVFTNGLVFDPDILLMGLPPRKRTAALMGGMRRRSR